MEKDRLYIDLKEVLKEHKHKLCVNPRTIRRILEELHINEEDEVIITGDFVDWGGSVISYYPKS